MSNPVNHHYISQCYLKQFTDENKLLYTLNIDLLKEGRAIRPSKGKTTSQVGFQKHLYTLTANAEFISGKFQNQVDDPFYIEKKLFSDTENKLEEIINSLIHFDILSKEKAVLMVRHMLTTKLRSPYTRKLMQPEGIKIVDKIVKEAIEFVKSADPTDIGLKTTKEELIQGAIGLRKRFDVDPNAMQQLQNSLLLTRNLQHDPATRFIEEHLLKFPWVIYKTNDKNKFITSDNPGFFLDRKTKQLLNTKFAKDFYFYYPLNPYNCLVISDEVFDDGYSSFKRYKSILTVQTSPPLVRQINTGSMIRGYKYIISDNVGSLTEALNIINDYGKIFL